MNAPLSLKDRQLLDRVLDDAATESDRARFEARMKDAAFAEAYGELRKLKELLGSTEPLQKDPAFWSRVSASIDEKKARPVDLLPVPRRFLPVFGAAFLILALFASSYLFENRLSFFRFWESQSSAVRDAVATGLQESSFLPVFTSLDPDRALQFALYGSLPLDEERGTMLNVDERLNEGYKIEVQKEQPRKQKKVTVDQFVAEVRPTIVQRAVLDSLLKQARKELEASVLMGENNTLAINTDLSRMNKAMASGIVGILEPEQRVRLRRLLSDRDVAYDAVPPSPEMMPAEAAFRSMVQSQEHRSFVILTPETVALARVHFDAEKMRKEMEGRAVHREWTKRKRQTIEMLAKGSEMFGGEIPGVAVASNISLRSRKDRLTIHVFQDSMPVGVQFFGANGAFVIADSAEEMDHTMITVAPEVAGSPTAVGRAARPRPRVVVVDTARPVERKPRRPFKLDIDRP